MSHYYIMLLCIFFLKLIIIKKIMFKLKDKRNTKEILAPSSFEIFDSLF